MKIDSSSPISKSPTCARRLGRKEIAIAESEMPALMAIRKEPARRWKARASPGAPHDDPDRGADRDAEGARRRGALGFVQHLLHAGPRRGRDRGERHAGVCLQGRVARRVLGVHPQDLRVRRCTGAQHDPRRRRRRDAAGPPRKRAQKDPGLLSNPTSEEEGGTLRFDQEAQARLVRRHGEGHQGRDRGDHHRRASPLPDGEGEAAALPGDQRERLGDRSPSSTTSTAAASRSSTASSARPTS